MPLASSNGMGVLAILVLLAVVFSVIVAGSLLTSVQHKVSGSSLVTGRIIKTFPPPACETAAMCETPYIGPLHLYDVRTNYMVTSVQTNGSGHFQVQLPAPVTYRIEIPAQLTSLCTHQFSTQHNQLLDLLIYCTTSGNTHHH